MTESWKAEGCLSEAWVVADPEVGRTYRQTVVGMAPQWFLGRLRTALCPVTAKGVIDPHLEVRDFSCVSDVPRYGRDARVY